MGKYEEIKGLKTESFRRLTGVKPEIFEKMVVILRTAHTQKKQQGGRPNKLNIEDMLLMALEYLREYRTYISERVTDFQNLNAYQTIKWVEDTLIKDGTFSLPGKKALLKSDVEYEVVLVDATETPVERPKSGKISGIPERKSDTQ